MRVVIEKEKAGNTSNIGSGLGEEGECRGPLSVKLIGDKEPWDRLRSGLKKRSARGKGKKSHKKGVCEKFCLLLKSRREKMRSRD